MNFNVNFNVLLSKYIVHPLVKIKKTDNIKMHSTTVKIKSVNVIAAMKATLMNVDWIKLRVHLRS